MDTLSAFKAYDIRGEYPVEVNEELAYSVGRALVKYLPAKTIVVGRDMRLSSPSLLAKIIEGITAEGADVINIGLCTTPMLNFSVAHYGYNGGIMVTASHNPGKDNAFKVIGPGAIQLDEDFGLSKIKEMVVKGFREGSQGGAITDKEVLNDYLSHILEFADDICDLKIAVDYGNGVGAISAKPLFARLDIEAIELYEEPDGTFPNHPANPHDEVNFKELKKTVIEQKCDLGIFFDGDADRATFVDEKGQIVPIDLLVTLFALDKIKKEKGGKVYYDLRFSKSIPNHIKKAGGEPIMMRVGNPFYKRKLAEEGGILGAEFSGHIMFPENYNMDDGLFAAVKTLSLLSKSDQPMSELIESVRDYYASPEESYEAPHPQTVHERLVAEFPEAKEVELDGTYLDFTDGFISVRQSKNEPQLFRARVEATTKEEMEKRFNKVINLIKS